ncbi:formyltetrahydrofolate deformylase [Hydrogenivirga sp. 128-5-R1-1]|uniref:formyltetrahydrofolate deformylase n=1 Tax=Hydrogenivirga sp. 128-5-R1-1 TaxID=392423 RepID=UPI00015F1854|nr:formyltetrahydrofolate deformylase [Hydrogenivirga sp. 128-5-R1-1]EDP75404.1 formyltetrahydrofolate deformylase [Hydrogenivirga sp. 128-5-R1-1]
MDSAILLISCPDRKGIVKEIASFIADNGGNILHFDQHIDSQKGIFFARVEWDITDFRFRGGDIEEAFKPIAERFSMNYSLHFGGELQRVAVFVSRQEHCFYDLMQRFRSGELKGDVKLVVSNHPDLKPIADFFGVPYYYIPKTKENKREAEEKELALLEEYGIDTIILARYMQILSREFVDRFRNRIINIHHSFLPAFPGAKPYHRAYERGVKIIGATSHYVTEILDEGPIIEQDIIRVSHRDSLEDFIRKGKDIERIVLARAVKWHLERKVLVYDNKTVVFD